jgi:hypothetical protein
MVMLVLTSEGDDWVTLMVMVVLMDSQSACFAVTGSSPPRLPPSTKAPTPQKEVPRGRAEGVLRDVRRAEGKGKKMQGRFASIIWPLLHGGDEFKWRRESRDDQKGGSCQGDGVYMIGSTKGNAMLTV